MRNFSFFIIVFAIICMTGCRKSPSTSTDTYDYSNGVMKNDVVELKIIPSSPLIYDTFIASVIYATDNQNSTTILTNYKLKTDPLVYYYRATKDYQPVFFHLNNVRNLPQVTLQIVVNSKVILEKKSSLPSTECGLSTPLNFVGDSPVNNPN